jgi:hypothetical protein
VNRLLLGHRAAAKRAGTRSEAPEDLAMMRRAVLASCFLAALCFLSVGADETAKTKPDPSSPSAVPGDAALSQEILSRKYKEFEQALLRLAQRLERSSRAEDRERAAVLKQAIEQASTAGIDNKFEKLISTLKASDAASLQVIQEAMAQNKTLAEDLQLLLALLRSENREELLKARIKRLEDLIKMIDKAIVDEKNVRAKTEGKKTSNTTLLKEQQKVTKFTEGISKEMNKDSKGNASKDGSGKKAESKPNESKGKGDGQGQGKSGDKKGQEGEPKQPSNSQQQPPPEGGVGKKQVQDAIEGQKRAEKELEQDKKENASKTQDKVIKDLEEARKKLEEILKQLREEEIERILAALQARCERMLALQIGVREDTGRLNDDIGKNSDKKPTRANEQKSLDLSKREDQIVVEANKAIEILEAEGSAVAFPEVFHQVRDDMKHVSTRLLKVDPGTVTQAIEDDIINTLKEMIEALKKAQNRSQSQSQSPGGQGGNQPLIDQIAELKMIRAMQVRINARTLTYAREYEGEEQVPAPGSGKLDADKASMIQKELKNLSERQLKLYDVVKNIATGKNR